MNHDEEPRTSHGEEAHKYRDELEECHTNHGEDQNDDTAHVHDKIRDVYMALVEHGTHHEALHDGVLDEVLVMALCILFHFQRI